MVVRMNRLIPATATAELLIGKIGDHLVDVHVHRCTAAAVHEVDRELIVVVTVRNFPGGFPDRSSNIRIEDPARRVSCRCSRLNMTKRRDQIGPLAYRLARHPEVAYSSSRMGSEERVRGNRDVSESVPFETEPCDDSISQLSVLVSRAFLVRTHDDTVIRWRASRSTESGSLGWAGRSHSVQFRKVLCLSSMPQT